MLLYVTLGAVDLDRSAAFYDAVLAPLGAARIPSPPGALAWSAGDGPALMLKGPFDGAPPTAGNGQMLALASPDRAGVDAIHRAAITSGGVCEGRPGERGPGFYAAYFRDPDGNKLAAVRIG